MSREKQIEEMAKVIDEFTEPLSARDIHKAEFSEKFAEHLTSKGYHKASEVAEYAIKKLVNLIKIHAYYPIETLSEMILQKVVDIDDIERSAEEVIAELKKKYTGEDINVTTKESENGYEGTLHLERCKLHDAEEKVKELTEKNKNLEQAYECADSARRELSSECDRLTEDNERLKAENEALAISEVKECEISQMLVYRIRNKHPAVMAVIADTVRKMQERCHEEAFTEVLYEEERYLIDLEDIDQIAKEMLEGL